MIMNEQTNEQTNKHTLTITCKVTENLDLECSAYI